MNTGEVAAEPTSEPRLVPKTPAKRDRLPIIVLVSLLVHAAILIPLMLRREPVVRAPLEIPVELVHAPPPAPPPRAAKRPDAPKPQPRAEPPKPKPPEPKPQEPKKQEPKKQEPKPPEPKKPERPAAKSETERMRDLLHEDAPSIDPAIALPGAGIGGTDAVSYTQLVMSKVAKTKSDAATQGTIGARVVVAFTLSDTGEVTSVRVKVPSGDAGLDKEAVAMVGRGAPYPAPPPGARHEFEFGLELRPVH